MEPISQTPTAQSDYALLSATYLAALAGIAEVGRRRGTFRIEQKELLPLSAATFALSRLVVKEKVETWMRAPFVEEVADGQDRRPRGRRLRYAIGELLTCTRCTGGWAALGLVGLRTVAPAQANVVNAVLVASAGSNYLHSAFSWLCSKSNLESELAGREHEHAKAARAHPEREQPTSGGDARTPRVTVSAH